MNELDITRIRAYAATPALMPAVRYTAFERLTKMNIEILRLTLANGVEGTASFASGWGGTEGGDIVRKIDEISGRVVGDNVRHRTTLTESLLEDAGEGPWEAISLVDCAMWDAFARTEGRPLWQMLGGHRKPVAAYASTVANLTIKDYLDDTRHYASLGYRAIKFHMNTDPEFDLNMVQEVSRAHRGDDLRFMVDLEQCYDFDQALRLGEALDKLPFDWMEAPLPDQDLAAYVELNKAIAIDVIPDGNVLLGMKHWTEGLRRKAWSRLRFDVTNAGGVTTGIKALELARSMKVPVELQSFGFQPAQSASLHLMLGLVGRPWFEHPAPHAPYDYATTNPPMLDSQGCISAAQAPGLGIDMDWGLIEADAFEVFDSRA